MWRTDGRTDGQTENTICRAAWSQLKTYICSKHIRVMLLEYVCQDNSFKTPSSPRELFWSRNWTSSVGNTQYTPHVSVPFLWPVLFGHRGEILMSIVMVGPPIDTSLGGKMNKVYIIIWMFVYVYEWYIHFVFALRRSYYMHIIIHRRIRYLIWTSGIATTNYSARL